MFEIGGVTYQYIGTGDVDLVANATKINSYADMTVGALAVVDSANKTIKGTAATGKVRIVQRVGNTLIYSPTFDMSNVSNAIHEDYITPNNQISYVGYNGSSGSLDEIASTTFVMQVILEHTQATANNSPFIKTVPYKTTGATQDELALGLVNSATGVFNTKTTPYGLIKFERTNDEAGVALGTSVDTLAFTKGSKYFSADDIDDATTNAALVVGDYLKVPTGNISSATITGTSGTAVIAFGGRSATATFNTNVATTASDFVTANAAAWLTDGVTLTNPSGAILLFTTTDGRSEALVTSTATTGDLDATVKYVTSSTDAIYKITAINTTTNIGTLDMAFQATSISMEDDSLLKILGATGLAGEFGIKMTGLDPASFNPDTDRHEKVSFHVTSEDFVTAEFTTAIEGTTGSGSYEDVSIQERYSYMNEGNRFRSTYPAYEARSEADASTKYDLITLSVYDQEFSDITGNSPKSKVQFILPVYKDSTQFTALKTVLGTSAA